jgi:hypothetical protein
MRRKMFKVERMMRSVRKEEDEKCEEGGRWEVWGRRKWEVWGRRKMRSVRKEEKGDLWSRAGNLLSRLWLFVVVLSDCGSAVVQLVEALRYKPEGRGFDSRWSHWNFSVT